jgi:ABC-type branched-subunit amino acid transport system permease subunit
MQGRGRGAPQPTLVAHPSGAALPAALTALRGLTELRVEGLVLPRRQLASMAALRTLALNGWDAVGGPRWHGAAAGAARRLQPARACRRVCMRAQWVG